MKKLVVLLFVSLIGGNLAFDSFPNTRCEHSCKGRCGDKPNKKYTCQCNEPCERFGDCCDDYSTWKYIDSNFNEETHHQQSDIDSNFNEETHHQQSDIDSNFYEETHHQQSDTDSNFNEATHHKKSDTSCRGRCGEKFNKKHNCHCNTKCTKYDNCCTDYDGYCCKGGINTFKHNKESASYGNNKYVGPDISKEEIKAVSEKLCQLDVNKAAESDIILNKQEKVEKDTTKEDLCDEPLYQYVNEELFERPTYAAFIRLLDNYDRKTGTEEAFSQEQLKEQEHFLQEVMKTDLMKELYLFFNEKGLYATEEEFVDDLQNMWFGLYSRSKGELDSSGFEHVFVGEVKKGSVSGFHSWIRFCHLEKKGILNYFSHNYDGPWTSYPDVLGKQFHWDGYQKEVGSQFIGSSPEFDLAVYTLCYIARPGKRCIISMEGHEIPIKTYEWTKNTYGNGKRYIATAYPEV